MHDTLHELIDKKWMVSALDADDADDAMVFKRSDKPLGEWLVKPDVFSIGAAQKRMDVPASFVPF